MNNKSNIYYKKKEIAGKVHFYQIYEEELCKLTNSSHNKKYVLLPLIESDRIIEWKRAKDCSVIYRKTLLFTEKSKINKILKDNNFFQGGWYIWTDYSDYCGMAKITELNMFNFNFNFSDEHSGNGGKEKCNRI